MVNVPVSSRGRRHPPPSQKRRSLRRNSDGSQPHLSHLRRHNATRHLSAAAYLDDAYCDRIMREIYAQPRRWAAPSYGYDLVTVLRNARSAWWLSTGQTLVLIGFLAVAAYLAGASTLLLVAALLIWWLAGVRLRIVSEYVRSLARTNPPEFYQQLKLRRRWANRGLLVVIAAGSRSIYVLGSSPA